MKIHGQEALYGMQLLHLADLRSVQVDPSAWAGLAFDCQTHDAVHCAVRGGVEQGGVDYAKHRHPTSSCMQQAIRRTFARYSYQARRRWCYGQARSLGDCPSPTCDKLRRFVCAANPCRPRPLRDGHFSPAARNASEVLAHSRVTLLFSRPRLGEMLQDAAQPQHGGAPGGFYDQARAWRLERRDFAQRSTYFEVKEGS